MFSRDEYEAACNWLKAREISSDWLGLIVRDFHRGQTTQQPKPVLTLKTIGKTI